jgi:hypothetical protein
MGDIYLIKEKKKPETAKKQTKMLGEILPLNKLEATGASRRFPGAG